jgi:hypothetical protein
MTDLHRGENHACGDSDGVAGLSASRRWNWSVRTIFLDLPERTL